MMAARHQHSVDRAILAHHTPAHSVRAARLIHEPLVQRLSKRLDTACRARVQRLELCDGHCGVIGHRSFAAEQRAEPLCFLQRRPRVRLSPRVRVSGSARALEGGGGGIRLALVRHNLLPQLLHQQFLLLQALPLCRQPQLLLPLLLLLLLLLPPPLLLPLLLPLPLAPSAAPPLLPPPLLSPQTASLFVNVLGGGNRASFEASGFTTPSWRPGGRAECECGVIAGGAILSISARLALIFHILILILFLAANATFMHILILLLLGTGTSTSTSFALRL